MSRRSSANRSGALDPALSHKKRARRRLVGAAAIALVAAIVLPMLLDSEPRQHYGPVRVEIAPRHSPLAAGASTAEPGTGGTPPAQVPPQQSSSSPGIPADSPVPAAQRAPGGASGARQDSADSGGDARAPREPGTSEAPGDSAEDDAAGAPWIAEPSQVPGGRALSPSKRSVGETDRPAAPTARQGEPSGPARAPAADAAPAANGTAEPPQRAEAPRVDAGPGRSAAASPPTGRDEARVALQIGAFARPGSADAMMQRARKAGVRAYTEVVHTAQGERTRVRVGPFASREAAERARDRLALVGVEAAFVTLHP